MNKREFRSFKELQGLFGDDVSPEIPVETTRASQKPRDIFARAFLAEHPGLRERISSVCRDLATHNIPMPVLHITSRDIRLEDGTEVPTDFVQKIRSEGFRVRDTNVGGFVDRKQRGAPLAHPSLYEISPEAFVIEMDSIAFRYVRHGRRVNKHSLGEKRGKGIGLPIALIVDSTKAALKRGSDFDNHFRFMTAVSGTEILSEVRLEEGDVLENLVNGVLDAMKQCVTETVRLKTRSDLQGILTV